MTLGLLALQFALCAALIGVAGYALCQSADRIATATGLSSGWVGLALLATVTSLPEMASGISSVTLMDAPDLAVGNVLGACMFNLVFLAVVDALQREQPIYRHASPSHLLSAAFGVVLLGVVAMGLLLPAATPAVGHLGLYSPVLLALYLLALRSIFAHEQSLLRPQAAPSEKKPEATSAPQLTRGLAREWTRFSLAALVVLVAGSWLPSVADLLAQRMGWSRSLAGMLLMALVTTLPEVAVTLSALRLRALDMAMGNLLGSNLFNLALLAFDDALYLRGPLLADASAVHAGTAMAAVVMSALIMVGLLMRPQGRGLRLVSWVSAGLLAVYLFNTLLVFLHGGA